MEFPIWVQISFWSVLYLGTILGTFFATGSPMVLIAGILLYFFALIMGCICISRKFEYCDFCGAKMENSNHRRECYEKNKTVIDTYTLVEDIQCPLCTGPIREWPKTRPFKQFQCQAGDPSCPIGFIRETGSKRHSCFLCGFDLCQECVQRRIQGRKNRDFVENVIDPPPPYKV